MITYPAPQIGHYCAECCILDLYRIDNEEELASAQDRIMDNAECGDLMVFPTLQEAVESLMPWCCSEDTGAVAEALRRLGVDPCYASPTPSAPNPDEP